VETPRTASATACGKLILFGEHFVVYNTPAVAIPFHGLRTDLSLRYPIHNANPDEKLLGWWKNACEVFSNAQELPDINNCELSVKFSIPPGSGVGASASLAIALIRAASRLFEVEIPGERELAVAMDLERYAHGNPSGIDHTVVYYDSSVQFQRGHSIRVLNDGQLLSALSGYKLYVIPGAVPGNTKAAVERVARYREQNRERFNQISESVGAISTSFCAGMTPGECIEAVNQNHEFLAEIGVETPELRAMREDAMRSGAAACKITGSGCGGNLIAVVADSDVERFEGSVKRFWKAGVQ
jgi:mevalonate kinase